MAGETTIQQVMDALAERVGQMPEIAAAHSTDIEQIQRFPTVIFSWFSDIDTTVNEGSTQLWIASAKCSLYMASIRGNTLRPSIVSYNDLIHKLVDTINIHPNNYPFGSKMANLIGVDRVNAVRVRPAEFGLEYAGHRYFGAEIFLDIKMHRRIEY